MYRQGQNNTTNKCQRNIIHKGYKDNHTYMNTVALSPKSSFKSPYYEKGKLKMMLEYGKRLSEENILNKNHLVDEIDDMVDHQKIKGKNNYFKAITTKPIISENHGNLLEGNYPIEENEMVRVCSSKIFQIKNYYNYLYQQETEKEVEKIERRNIMLETLYKINEPKDNISEEYEFQGEKTVNKKQQRILDPIHSKYSSPLPNFNVKEKDRLKISTKADSPQRKKYW